MSDHVIDWGAARPPCVIMCGGRSSRFAARHMHKSMAAVDGVPLLRHVIDYWRRYSDEFIFVVKNGREAVVDYVGQLGLDARFVEPAELRGIADGLCYCEPFLDRPFITVLGDCFCQGEFALDGVNGYGVGVRRDSHIDAIRRNFAVEIADGAIVRLEEKPRDPPNDLCGLGFYFFLPDVFRHIRATAPSQRSGEIEITDVLQTIANKTRLHAVTLDGTYVNVNVPEDLDAIGLALAERGSRSADTVAGS